MTRWLLVSALLLTACSGTTGAPEPGGPAGQLVTVEKTGGFAGVQEAVLVDPSGKWTVTGQAAGSTTEGGRLTMADSEKLQALAADPRFAVEASATRAPTKCADAFAFAVTVGTATVRYSDCSSDSPLPAVASEIADLVMAAAGTR
jgi:hypothetical protein